jgi:hypothetical protein
MPTKDDVVDSVVMRVGDWSHNTASGSVATFSGLSPEGAALVELSPGGVPLCALSTIALAADDIGSRVVVVFQDADASRPIIIGRLQDNHCLRVDNQRLVIEAGREIELRCGEASIVLTRAGKVLIRGNYVLSRSRGANKIKGAFVDIN